MHVEIEVAGSTWTCQATLADPLSGDEKEGFDFLMALDPVFTLRLDANGTLMVDVIAVRDGGRLALRRA